MNIRATRPLLITETVDMSEYVTNRLNLSNLCRVCLTMGMQLQSVNQSDFPKMFQAVTGLAVQENDDEVFSKICIHCICTCTTAYTFIQKAQKSEIVLRTHISPLFQELVNAPQPPATNVKAEKDLLVQSKPVSSSRWPQTFKASPPPSKTVVEVKEIKESAPVPSGRPQRTNVKPLPLPRITIRRTRKPRGRPRTTKIMTPVLKPALKPVLEPVVKTPVLTPVLQKASAAPILTEMLATSPKRGRGRPRRPRTCVYAPVEESDDVSININTTDENEKDPLAMDTETIEIDDDDEEPKTQVENDSANMNEAFTIQNVSSVNNNVNEDNDKKPKPILGESKITISKMAMEISRKMGKIITKPKLKNSKKALPEPPAPPSSKSNEIKIAKLEQTKDCHICFDESCTNCSNDKQIECRFCGKMYTKTVLCKHLLVKHNARYKDNFITYPSSSNMI